MSVLNIGPYGLIDENGRPEWDGEDEMPSRLGLLKALLATSKRDQQAGRIQSAYDTLIQACSMLMDDRELRSEAKAAGLAKEVDEGVNTLRLIKRIA